jgi:hypothetical protein
MGRSILEQSTRNVPHTGLEFGNPVLAGFPDRTGAGKGACERGRGFMTCASVIHVNPRQAGAAVRSSDGPQRLVWPTCCSATEEPGCRWPQDSLMRVRVRASHPNESTARAESWLALPTTAHQICVRW